ncbi:MAG TPA: transposase [Polyangia bacterium]|nr:transposase [Polyangia bacterium]
MPPRRTSYWSVSFTQADCLRKPRPLTRPTTRDPDCRFLFSRNGSRVPTEARSVPVLFACTAYERLLRRVKQTYSWLQVVVADGLYPNGPFLTVVKELRMGAVIIARKDGDEPLKEALAIWGKQPPHEVFEDKKNGERVELWDCRDITTLSTYDGPIRVVRAVVTDQAQANRPSHTWCMVATGVAATRLSSRQVLAIARGRWHIENTGFHQWVTRWYFEHVFVHDAVGIQAIFWLFFAGFNLLTLFLYKQLRSYGRDRDRDVTRTISRLIDEMNDDLARLDCSPWDSS